MNTAFVLIKTAPQKELDVYLTLLDLEAVSETHVSYGEYDLVARIDFEDEQQMARACLLYTSPSPRDSRVSRMPSSA